MAKPPSETDFPCLTPLMMLKFAKQTVYQGFFKWSSYLKHRLFEGGWSQTIQRELFVRGDAVAAIIYDSEHDLPWWSSSYRRPNEPCGLGVWRWSFKMIDKGETPEQVVSANC